MMVASSASPTRATPAILLRALSRSCARRARALPSCGPPRRHGMRRGHEALAIAGVGIVTSNTTARAGRRTDRTHAVGVRADAGEAATQPSCAGSARSVARRRGRNANTSCSGARAAGAALASRWATGDVDSARANSKNSGMSAQVDRSKRPYVVASIMLTDLHGRDRGDIVATAMPRMWASWRLHYYSWGFSASCWAVDHDGDLWPAFRTSSAQAGADRGIAIFLVARCLPVSPVDGVADRLPAVARHRAGAIQR